MSGTSDSIDWIGRAGAKARGRRPAYFDNPAIDRILSMVMALTGELAVVRERLDTVERLLEAKGSISREDIENYAPDRQAGEERGTLTAAYVARIMRGMQQEMEAMREPDPPVEHWIDTFSRP